MDHGPLSMESEGSDSDMERTGVLASTRKVSKTPFRLLVACVVVGTVGLAGIGHFGLPTTGAPPQQPLSPLTHYSTLMQKFGAHVLSAIHDPSKMNKISMAHYNTFVKKFAARMLTATSTFEENTEIVFREKGSTVPNAMNIVVASKEAKPGKGMTLKVTTLAKAGQQAALESTLGELKQMVETITVTKQGTDSVVIDFPMPPNGPGQQAEQDMMAGLKATGTKVLIDLTLGTTLEDLHKNREKNIIRALNGFSLKSKASVATEVLGAAVGVMEGEEEIMYPDTTDEEAAKDFKPAKFMELLAEVSSKTEFLYRPEANFSKSLGVELPTVEMLLGMLKGPLMGMPPPVIDLIKKITLSCDGVSGVELSGGDAPIEFVATMKNFKPMKLVADLAEELE